MKTQALLCFLAAVGFHAFLLFGLKLERPPHPHPTSDQQAVDVELVAGAPGGDAANKAEAVQSSPPTATPEPTPASEPKTELATTPEPVVAPTPATVEPTPEPTATPETSKQPEIVATPTPEAAAVSTPTSKPESHHVHEAHPKPESTRVVHKVSGKPAVETERAVAVSKAGSGRPNVARASQHPGMGRGSGPGGNGSGLTTGVRYRTNPRPEYPAEARELRQQGEVILHVTVSAAGLPQTVALKRSSGFPLLDRAAIQTVRHWTFEPARAAGVPVASQADVPVHFRLSD